MNELVEVSHLLSLANRYPQLCFNYKEPERNFDHSTVKGLVAKLVGLRDSKTATALEVVAGGKVMYFY